MGDQGDAGASRNDAGALRAGLTPLHVPRRDRGQSPEVSSPTRGRPSTPGAQAHRRGKVLRPLLRSKLQVGRFEVSSIWLMPRLGDKLMIAACMGSYGMHLQLESPDDRSGLYLFGMM